MQTNSDGTALVTGAGRGIGLACARALAQAGYPLIISDVNADNLAVAAKQLRGASAEVDTVVGDLGARETLDAVAAKIAGRGGLAACVHAAGISGTMAAGARIIEINLVVTARLLDLLLPLVNEGAGIVCIASQAGHFIAPAATDAIDAILEDPLTGDCHTRLAAATGVEEIDSDSAYSWSKYGVRRLVIARAAAFGARGARIVSLSPGIIDTSMGAQEMAAHKEAMNAIIAATPVAGRQGTPEEIASVAAFLCSPGASFVCGTDILVDGGSTQQVLRGS
jgi:NAD(P)-dependent dehydrogenase (short-subunit alcohol dehydrogenase family)